MESPTVTVRSEADGVYVVACKGEFDQDTVGVLADACDGEASGASLLVVDVAGVLFADSAFLNVLIRLRNTRRLVLAGPVPHQLHRLLELTGALALFEFREEDSAQAG
ncbi:STAS domain-containing protein [Streptomyces subrutilus]|uniref:STAS domain-containing protein n=1 Tax=Streptomyces subrutilus TaxID=36818 RepID=UPI001431B0FF|nr:STAS domain-containing protein [Streptomyces subrutilus]